MKRKIISLFFMFTISLLFSETVKLPDGSIYTGELKNGLFNGIGVQSWKSGATYEGEFKDGLYNGTGKLITCQYVYEGIFIDGMKDVTPETIKAILRSNIPAGYDLGKDGYEKMINEIAEETR